MRRRPDGDDGGRDAPGGDEVIRNLADTQAMLAAGASKDLTAWLRFRNPPWGMRYPLLREVTYRGWIPIWSRRGFSQLLRMAEERERAEGPKQTTAVHAASRRPKEDVM